MKVMIGCICVLLLILCVANDVQADSRPVGNTPGLIVFRDSTGSLTESSRDAAKKMRQLARKQGHITLWLTLNYEINLYLDENTEKEAIETQNQAVRDGLNEVLDPMIARGAVWHPNAGQYIRGPGCLIRANVSGLKRLIKDKRILQIVSAD